MTTLDTRRTRPWLLIVAVLAGAAAVALVLAIASRGSASGAPAHVGIWHLAHVQHAGEPATPAAPDDDIGLTLRPDGTFTIVNGFSAVTQGDYTINGDQFTADIGESTMDGQRPHHHAVVAVLRAVLDAPRSGTAVTIAADDTRLTLTSRGSTLTFTPDPDSDSSALQLHRPAGSPEPTPSR